MNGRSILRVALCVLAVAGTASHGLAAEVTHGAIAGGVTESSARFWVRLSGAEVVAFQVSVDPGFSTFVSSAAESATQARNFAAIAGISGLQPDTRYYYRAVVGGVPHAGVRSFMTFPTPGTPSTFTVAFGSCQQNNGSLSSTGLPGNVFRAVAAASPRVFLQIGDWGYPDTTANLPVDSNYFAADYATVQATYLSKFDPSYLMDTVLAMTPVNYAYDDHDFMSNNASATTASYFLPYRPNPFGTDFVAREIGQPAGARENSIRGYIENMPTYPPVNPTRGVYHSFRLGTAEFFMLDLRSQRSPNLAPFRKEPLSGRWVFEPGAGHSILGGPSAPGTGETQMSWLKQALLASTARWKFLVSSVPFNKGFTQVLSLGMLLQDFPVDYPGLPPGTTGIGAAFEVSDKWAGFERDQTELLEFIRDRAIQNVIVLSGDLHTSAIDDGANAGLPELMAANLDIANSQIVAALRSLGIDIWNKGAQGVSTTEYYNTFGKVTVFGEDSVRLALVDEFGLEFAAHTIASAPTGVEEDVVGLPGTFELGQNFPNPFNPSTTVPVAVPVTGEVTVTIYSILGEEIRTLYSGMLERGRHWLVWDGRNDAGRAVATGMYLTRMATPAGGSFVIKMLMLK